MVVQSPSTLVRPLVEYCNPVWSPHLKNNINKVERVQTVATWFVIIVTLRPYHHSAPDSRAETNAKTLIHF